MQNTTLHGSGGGFSMGQGAMAPSAALLLPNAASQGKPMDCATLLDIAASLPLGVYAKILPSAPHSLMLLLISPSDDMMQRRAAMQLPPVALRFIMANSLVARLPPNDLTIPGVFSLFATPFVSSPFELLMDSLDAAATFGGQALAQAHSASSATLMPHAVPYSLASAQHGSPSPSA